MGEGLLHRFRRPRSFRVQIIVLFLSLFACAFACVMGFTYTKDYRNILSLSQTVADETIETIRIQFQSIASGAERVTRTGAGFFPSLGPLSVHNLVLKSYLLSVLREDPHFSNIYVGLPDGGVVLAMKTVRGYLPGHPTQRLPAGVAFALACVERSSQAPATHWVYFDSELKPLSLETASSAPFDVRERPWYLGAKRADGLFWTRLYPYHFFEERLPTDAFTGITVSHVLRNVHGEFAGVIGADLSLELFSRFLSSVQVGEGGNAFIFDREETQVAPNYAASKESSALALRAFKQFQADPSRSDVILKQEGTQYLAFTTPLMDIFGSNWVAVVVTPLKQVLGHVIQVQQEVLLFVILIGILSSVVVVYFSRRISSPIGILSQEIEQVSQFHLEEHAPTTSSVREIVILDRAIASMKQVVQSFARYIPLEVVKNLLKTHMPVALGGKKAALTVFFSDIAQFTTIAESHPVDELMPLLEEYFASMSRIILEKGGTIDKFMGDGIMAFWGAPLPDPHHPERACEAALLCSAMLKGFNAKRQEEGKPAFFTRFGLHSGPVIVGNIGTEERMNYTVIGDVVNTTARLQEVDKVYHTSILISEEVYKSLGPEYIGRPVDVVAVKGKTRKTKIYELLGKRGETQIEPSPEDIELCSLFTAAYALLSQGLLSEARKSFQDIARQFPRDFLTQMYLDRIH